MEIIALVIAVISFLMVVRMINVHARFMEENSILEREEDLQGQISKLQSRLDTRDVQKEFIHTPLFKNINGALLNHKEGFEEMKDALHLILAEMKLEYTPAKKVHTPASSKLEPAKLVKKAPVKKTK